MDALEIATDLYFTIYQTEVLIESMDNIALIKYPTMFIAASNSKTITLNDKEPHIEKIWTIQDLFQLRAILNTGAIKKRFPNLDKIEGPHLDWLKPVYLIFGLE